MENRIIGTIIEFWKKNTIMALVIYALFTILFAVTFYNSSALLTITTATRIYFFFALIPMIMYSMYYSKIILPRLIVTAVSYLASLIILSYYLAIIGINVKYHIFIVPIIILTGALIVAIIWNPAEGIVFARTDK